LSEKRSRGHDFSFCELDFDDEEEVRLQHNQRISELQALGMVCTAENLYRVDGKRVHLLTAKTVIKDRGWKIMRLG